LAKLKFKVLQRGQPEVQLAETISSSVPWHARMLQSETFIKSYIFKNSYLEK